MRSCTLAAQPEDMDLPLLLIAGWRSPLASFAPLASALSRQVEAVALPGLEFQRPPSTGGMSITELAADVSAAADDLDLTRFAVAGHGHGANVALALGAHDERVQAAVLLDGGYYTYRELYTQDEWLTSARHFSRRDFPDRAAFEIEFQRVVFEPAEGRWTQAWATARDAFVRTLHDGGLRLHFDPQTDERQLTDGYAFDALAFVPASIPILLALGTRTYSPARRELFEQAAARFAAAFPTCTVTHIDAGHYPHLDRPAETAAAMTRFLASAHLPTTSN